MAKSIVKPSDYELSALKCNKCGDQMGRKRFQKTYICSNCGAFKMINTADDYDQDNNSFDSSLSEESIEMIEQVISLFQEHGIDTFNYLTHLLNLNSIYSEGLRTRNSLLEDGVKFKDISKDRFQNYRQKCFNTFFREDIHNYVPLYISSHSRMVKPISSPYKHNYALLKVEIFLFYGLTEENLRQVKISNSSINQKYPLHNFEIMNLFDNINKLEDFLDWELFNTNLHHENPCLGQKKSAEILIPDTISPNYISKVCPKCSENVFKRNIYNAKMLNITDFNHNEFVFL